MKEKMFFFSFFEIYLNIFFINKMSIKKISKENLQQQKKRAREKKIIKIVQYARPLWKHQNNYHNYSSINE